LKSLIIKPKANFALGFISVGCFSLINPRYCYANLKYKYVSRNFWCKKYYADPVVKNTAAIKEYIANQLKQDKEADQLSVFDPKPLSRITSNKCRLGRLIKSALVRRR